jgi:hypothetical protein
VNNQFEFICVFKKNILFLPGIFKDDREERGAKLAFNVVSSKWEIVPPLLVQVGFMKILNLNFSCLSRTGNHISFRP